MLSLAEIASTDLSKSRFNKQTLYLSWNIKYPEYYQWFYYENTWLQNQNIFCIHYYVYEHIAFWLIAKNMDIF